MAARSVWLILFGSLGCFVQQASPVVAQSASGGDKLVRIQDYPGSITNLPHWVVVDGGFCSKQKIKRELVPIPSGPVALKPSPEAV